MSRDTHRSSIFDMSRKRSGSRGSGRTGDCSGNGATINKGSSNDNSRSSTNSTNSDNNNSSYGLQKTAGGTIAHHDSNEELMDDDSIKDVVSSNCRREKNVKFTEQEDPSVPRLDDADAALSMLISDDDDDSAPTDEHTPLIPKYKKGAPAPLHRVPTFENDDSNNAGDTYSRRYGVVSLAGRENTAGLVINERNRGGHRRNAPHQQQQARPPGLSPVSPAAALMTKKAAALILASFFSLGAASDISWNAVYMSVAYFESLEGKSVITTVGLAQNIPWLVIMIAMFAAPSFASTASFASKVILVTHSYMLCMCIIFPIIVFLDLEMPSVVLYILMVGNGFATGLSQSLVAFLSGIFAHAPGGKTKSATSYQLIGAGFGISTPTLIQLFLLPMMLSAASSDDSYKITLLSMKVIFPAAALYLVLSIFSLLFIMRTHVFQEAKLEGPNICKRRCTPLVTEPPTNKVTLKTVKPLLHVLFAEMLVSLVMSYVCASTPFLVPVHATPFWKRNLDTVCLIAFSLCNFVGRALPEQLVKWHSMKRVLDSGRTVVVLVAIQIVFGVGVVLYTNFQDAIFGTSVSSWDDNNSIVLAWFSVGAVLSGVALVGISRYAQLCCTRTGTLPCMTTSQLVWLSIQTGSVLGLVTSFGNR